MKAKRVTIFSGHYGSGKTNIAITFALNLKKSFDNVTIADIDIVNPYFRTKDSEEFLKGKGIKLICSPYANSNVDIPALPQEIYAITDDKSVHFVLDVGGDERGALALGRIAPTIKEEDDYDMFFVVNKYRPLTCDIDGAMQVLNEIESACGLKFTGVINNSNLGKESSPETLLKTIEFAKQLATTANIPFLYSTASEQVVNALGDCGVDVRPIRIQTENT